MRDRLRNVLWTKARPPCSSAIERTTAGPSPVLSGGLRVASARQNRSKRWGRCFPTIPLPLSATEMGDPIGQACGAQLETTATRSVPQGARKQVRQSAPQQYWIANEKRYCGGGSFKG